jgi:glycine/D-amino acid oxidase-like deaminating enzyme
VHVAVLGAGIQGVCASLELARRGCRVDLYDRSPQPVSEASLWNEGKLHLGLVFANDRADRTARTMTFGSLHFDRCLRRWGVDIPEEDLSEPFNYVVHRESMLTPEEVEVHFCEVAAQYSEMREQRGAGYLGERSDRVFERLGPAELDGRYDESRTVGAFRTIERSIDPERLAERLREAIEGEGQITFLGARDVDGAEDAGPGRWSVCSRNGRGSRTGRIDDARAAEVRNGYSHVVNALWGDRLRVDARLGLAPRRPWLFRYKLALHAKPSEAYPSPPPSTTIVLGPFGDIVNFSGRRLYLSWYPACRLASTEDLAPGDLGGEVTEEDRLSVFRSTLAELSRIAPELGGLDLDYRDTEVAGGVIFTWGRGEITDPASELHRRYEVGVHSRGDYHSVDTGKYCLAPYFALAVAERIRPAV